MFVSKLFQRSIFPTLNKLNSGMVLAQSPIKGCGGLTWRNISIINFYLRLCLRKYIRCRECATTLLSVELSCLSRHEGKRKSQELFQTRPIWSGMGYCSMLQFWRAVHIRLGSVNSGHGKTIQSMSASLQPAHMNLLMIP